jgi:DNA polymerase III delta prime subunit
MNLSWQQKIGNFENGFFHHAFLIEGNPAHTGPALRVFIEEELKIPTVGNPDFSVQEFVSFGIDDGRALKEMQSRRAFTEGGKKMFVVIANTFTTEAQNSLLKIFEEPTDDTHFFILAFSTRFFLPTLLSRVVSVSAEEESGEENFGEAPEFLKMPYAERLAFVQKITKDEKDASRSERLMEDIIRFFNKKNAPGKRTREEIRTLELALKYRQYAHGKAPSFKMMLEHLALVAPR